MATKKTSPTKPTPKTTPTKKGTKKAPCCSAVETVSTSMHSNVKPYIRRIVGYINPATGGWKTRWTAQAVATKLGLTKMQVAAVLAHFNMGTYSDRPSA